MAQEPLCIDILFGGMGEEHDVSILSAAAIINGLLKSEENYIIHPVFIDKSGKWLRSATSIKEQLDSEILKKNTSYFLPVFPSPGLENGIYVNLPDNIRQPDFFFLALHGRFSEDGAIQGFLKTAGFKFSGSDITGSACSMDKEIMKKLFHYSELPLLPWFSFTKAEWRMDKNRQISKAIEKTSFPLFVKPASQGSSIGISKVENQESFSKAVNEAFKFDCKVVVEQAADVREIECGVMEKGYEIIVSDPGEIIPGEEFYTYEDKYLLGKSAIQIPADISAKNMKTIRQLAETAFRSVNAGSYSRIDFFLTKDDNIYINEINSLPGFTDASMFPLLMKTRGFELSELLTALIQEKLDN